jgi:hypothetical protein
MSVTDPMLRRVLTVGRGLAQTDGRETFGVLDVLRAFVRDVEVSGLLTDLGLDLDLLRERLGPEPPAADATRAD